MLQRQSSRLLSSHGASSSAPAAPVRAARPSCARQACRAYASPPEFYTKEVEKLARFNDLLLQVPTPKDQALRAAVESYFSDVWNAGATERLNDLVADGVVYSDVEAYEEDHFGRHQLTQLISSFHSSHPLLHITVDDIITDTDHDTVVAHWHAVCADLLPHADGTPATGEVSEVHGMDEFVFDQQRVIKGIASFRERFAEERMA